MSPTETLDNDPTGLLSEASMSALQLHQQPFRAQPAKTGASPGGTSPPEFFSDNTTDEQLADIKQALITGDDLLLILGDKGAGKSTLLRQLGEQSGLRIQCFAVNGGERFSTLNLFAGMLEAFKRKPTDKLKDILDELIPCLQSMVARNILSVVILDDAHKVSHYELTQLLSAMLYINSQDETLMRVALAASIEFEDRIPDLLPEGADLPYSSLTIDGYTPQRAAAYLASRLQGAGFQDEFPFSERDMASLVDHSNGLPRQLNVLTADVLNEKHGRLTEVMPSELETTARSSFLQSRHGKLVLGAVATACILAGLFLFLPQQDSASTASPIAQQEVEATDDPQTELVLLDQNGQAVSSVSSDSNANSSNANTAATTVDTVDSSGTNPENPQAHNTPTTVASTIEPTNAVQSSPSAPASSCTSGSPTS